MSFQFNGSHVLCKQKGNGGGSARNKKSEGIVSRIGNAFRGLLGSGRRLLGR